MARDDFTDVERDWKRRRLFGPPKRRPKVGVWLVMAGLLASGMYIAAQTVLPIGSGKPFPTADAWSPEKASPTENPR